MNATKDDLFTVENSQLAADGSVDPDAETGLGPLRAKPDTSVSPARCDP